MIHRNLDKKKFTPCVTLFYITTTFVAGKLYLSACCYVYWDVGLSSVNRAFLLCQKDASWNYEIELWLLALWGLSIEMRKLSPEQGR